MPDGQRGSSGVDRRDFFKIVGVELRGRRRRRLRQDDRGDPAVRHPAPAHRPRRGDLVRDRVPRVPGRLRGAGQEPRGPGRQARGQPRPPGEPGRALRPRPGLLLAPTTRTGSRARACATADDVAHVPVADAQKLLVEKLAAARQAGAGRIAMISQLETGSLGRLMDDWLKALGGRPRVAFEPFAHEALRAANRATFGIDAIPYHAFEDAKSVLSLGADYLETWISPVGYAGGFRRTHALRDGDAASVIHVEPRYSMTAASADEWLPNRPGHRGSGRPRPPAARPRGAPGPGAARQGRRGAGRAGPGGRRGGGRQAERRPGRPAEAPRRGPGQARRAWWSGRRGGDRIRRDDTAVAINLLNYALGNVGQTVRFGPNASPSAGEPLRGPAWP